LAFDRLRLWMEGRKAQHSSLAPEPS